MIFALILSATGGAAAAATLLTLARLRWGVFSIAANHLWELPALLPALPALPPPACRGHCGSSSASAPPPRRLQPRSEAPSGHHFLGQSIIFLSFFLRNGGWRILTGQISDFMQRKISDVERRRRSSNTSPGVVVFTTKGLFFLERILKNLSAVR